VDVAIGLCVMFLLPSFCSPVSAVTIRVPVWMKPLLGRRNTIEEILRFEITSKPGGS